MSSEDHRTALTSKDHRATLTTLTSNNSDKSIFCDKNSAYDNHENLEKLRAQHYLKSQGEAANIEHVNEGWKLRVSLLKEITQSKFTYNITNGRVKDHRTIVLSLEDGEDLTALQIQDMVDFGVDRDSTIWATCGVISAKAYDAPK